METDEPNVELLKNISKQLHESGDKYWKELTPDEKIERMRSEVKNLKISNSNLWDLVNNLMLQMESHEHLNGKVVLPLMGRIGMGGMEVRLAPSANPDEVYF